MDETTNESTMFDGITAPFKLLQDAPVIGKSDIIFSMIYGFIAGWLTRAYTLRDQLDINAFGLVRN